MTSPNDEDVDQEIDPLAPQEAPSIDWPMFGQKAYEYTIDRMRDLQVWMTLAPPGTYAKQMAYYSFVKQLLEDINQKELEAQVGRQIWKKRGRL